MTAVILDLEKFRVEKCARKYVLMYVRKGKKEAEKMIRATVHPRYYTRIREAVPAHFKAIGYKPKEK